MIRGIRKNIKSKAFSVPAFIILICIIGACITPDNTVQNPVENILHGEFGISEIKVGNKIYIVEVADSPEKYYKGLSGRSELQDNGGMLFIYPKERNVSFWMKDTNLFLSIAFIRKDGTITEIHHMYPNSRKSVISEEPIMFALELPYGAFSDAGLQVGDCIDLSKFIAVYN